MLPFLKPKNTQMGMAMEYRKPDDGKEEKPRQSEDLEMAAKDLLQAISSNDSKKLAAALKACYDILESAEDEPMEVEQAE